jgi:hypothetical protein
MQMQRGCCQDLETALVVSVRGLCRDSERDVSATPVLRCCELKTVYRSEVCTTCTDTRHTDELKTVY